MAEKDWLYIGNYSEAELLVIKSLLEGENIMYQERLASQGEVLRLYTSSAGVLGGEIFVHPEDAQRVRTLLAPQD